MVDRMSEMKRVKFLRLIGYASLVLLVAYVASIGPVVGAVQTQQGTALEYVAPITAFYAPVIWVIDRNAFLEEFVRRYIAFCSPDF